MPEQKLADNSCECCRIALAPAPDGSLVAMWRHVFDPGAAATQQRDHAFAPVASIAAPPVRASFDHWALEACPHHGPGLAPADPRVAPLLQEARDAGIAVLGELGCYARRQ